jgi:biopolymer transport protein ExbD
MQQMQETTARCVLRDVRVRFERGGRARRRPGLTPLIDVVFLLLVFFMLASRFDRENALSLSVATSGDSGDSAAVLRIELDAAGRATIDGALASDARIRSEAARAARDALPLRVRPSPDTALQPIVDVLGTLERAGAPGATLERAEE